jgi:8-oxo-dGTP pyrophosphatase MutT (NUDIX family)
VRTHLLARGVVLRDGARGPEVLLAQQIGARHTFLPGGHHEAGERMADVLLREIEEELGLSGRVVRYLGAVEHAWPDPTPTEYELNHCFALELDDAADQLDSREAHLRFEWCPVEALADRNLLAVPLRELIARYAAGDTTTWWASTLKES